MMVFRIFLLCILAVLRFFPSVAPVTGKIQSELSKPRVDLTDSLATIWADSRMSVMNWDQKVGQLFMVEAYSNRSEEHQNSLLGLV
ncbi:MAG: hypothetical protein ACO3O0_05705, partial [Bacteroidia bacterium]